MSTTKHSILCVDDEEEILKSLKRTLRKESFNVLTAVGGREGLSVLEQHEVQLVISDQRMPEMTGTEFLEEVKQLYPDIVRVILSGYTDINCMLDAINKGEIYRFTTKPWNEDELKKTIYQGIEQYELLNNLRQQNERSASNFYLDQEQYVGQYHILRRLGQGSMGVVYLAEKLDDSDKEYYAIKMLKPSVYEEEHKFACLERFKREAYAASKVKHPNIVEIIEFGFEGSQPFIVMEYIQGISLKYFMGSEQFDGLDDRLKTKIIRQIAIALEKMHSMNIYHRDIKPDNIIVDDDLNAKITDFGIARLPESELTLTKETFGTPNYLSPEAFNTAKVDHRSDFFSLGILAYLFYLCRQPFPTGNIALRANAVQNFKPIAPRQLRQNFPLQLQGVLAKLLKKSPGDRYQSATEIVADLDVYLSDEIGKNNEKYRERIEQSDDWEYQPPTKKISEPFAKKVYRRIFG